MKFWVTIKRWWPLGAGLVGACLALGRMYVAQAMDPLDSRLVAVETRQELVLHKLDEMHQDIKELMREVGHAHR